MDKTRLAALYAAYEQAQVYERDHGVKMDGVIAVQGVYMTKAQISAALKAELSAAKAGGK